ncbi:ATP-binding protein [Providencia rettgeri]|uniref:ATP-binding protein n=1 Tax=Providencia sp. PROV269 TaxID=2949957 RepID=UPI00234B4DDE|nr:ATP-binding protein [Providencia sp. PROV269]ELR5295426.1 ATP-binding protein [Providencia rettgeri]MCL0013660.1 ATP-binding protein [Providencia rettgeri]
MAQMSVSARAVDMLGRQQIAGIPTAIHELFKNAHDAYANNAEIDYYQNQNLVVLRDDGIGMTEEDFIRKWLTIGTSSKYGVNRKSDYIPMGMNERKLMGEKGIGRLAIASIGRQVVVLTRAERNDGLHDMVVGLIHWSQFEIPDISISDIIIPIRTFGENTLPTADDLKSMSDELISNLKKLGNKIPTDYFNLIEEDSKLLNFSPKILFENLQKQTEKNWEKLSKQSELMSIPHGKKPKLDGIGKGTHFIIIPCDETLALDVKTNNKSTTELQKILVGFSNPLSEEQALVLKTKFRLHQGNADAQELIEASFFSKADAGNGDHFIEGKFDEYGQFKGFVTVFRGEPQYHIINWNDNFGQKTRCGPFNIQFTYLQGDSSESLVPPDIYVDIKNKLTMYGGLYLYKDGIRVLPYGKQEFDFLRFEEKRTKNAGTAFFSHRLMFGAIDIEHDKNSELEEKAGREGLRENTAYREFKGVLENFFEQLAIDFFRDSSVNDRFSEIKNKFRQEALAEKELLAKRKKLIGPKKDKLQAELDSFFDDIKDGYYIRETNGLVSFVESELAKSDSSWTEKEKSDHITSIRNFVSSSLKDLDKKIKITKPNIGLNKQIKQDWVSYLKNREKIINEIINVEKQKIEFLLSSYIQKNKISFSLRSRATERLEDEKKTLSKSISNYKNELTENVEIIDSTIKNKARAKSTEFTNALSEIMAEINSTPIDTLPIEKSMSYMNDWDARLDDINMQTETYFTKMRDTIEQVLSEINNDELNSVDILSALENENEKYKESLNQYFEFAQLGMSLGIIQHEFSSTARNVRESIRSLKPWANKNEKLGKLYNNINHSFSHLDGYLKMFTPLNRRLYRSKIELSGKEIKNYLQDIFNERLSRHNIHFESTNDFLTRTTEVYPSSFLPVFINVVDNAIYWLNTQSDSENPFKTIKLDVDGESLTISNNGPEIAIQDKDRIFDFTFSRKSSGRGMGLYISKQSLNNEGFDIQLINGGASASPCFAISKQISEEA